jgi:hypothetical protein
MSRPYFRSAWTQTNGPPAIPPNRLNPPPFGKSLLSPECAVVDAVGQR